MPATRDPYDLLGLERTAEGPQIKRAYRRLAKHYHPDVVQGDAKLFVALRGAYDTLIDPERRLEWDRRHPSSGRPFSARAGSTIARAATGGTARETDGPWRPRDARGRFVRVDGTIPWWEDIRGGRRVSQDVPGSRGEPHLGPSSGGAAWSMAARAYHRRLTRQDSGPSQRHSAGEGRADPALRR